MFSKAENIWTRWPKPFPDLLVLSPKASPKSEVYADPAWRGKGWRGALPHDSRVCDFRRVTMTLPWLLGSSLHLHSQLHPKSL